MLGPRGQDVDAGRVDAGMAQDICQLSDILFHPIKGSGKQVAQVVGKHFVRQDTGLPAECLHFSPNIASIQWMAVFCHKNHPGGDPAASGIVQ